MKAFKFKLCLVVLILFFSLQAQASVIDFNAADINNPFPYMEDNFIITLSGVGDTVTFEDYGSPGTPNLALSEKNDNIGTPSSIIITHNQGALFSLDGFFADDWGDQEPSPIYGFAFVGRLNGQVVASKWISVDPFPHVYEPPALFQGLLMDTLDIGFFEDATMIL